MPAELKGSHPWAVFLCYPSDLYPPRWPDVAYFTRFIGDPGAGGLYSWWHDVSSGVLDFSGSQTFGWLQLPYTLDDVNAMDRWSLLEAAMVASEQDLYGFRHRLAFVLGRDEQGNVGSDVVAGITPIAGEPGWPQQEPGWRWCSKCEALAYWDGSRDPGPCADPSGGQHDYTTSGYYAVLHDVPGDDSIEGDWGRCQQCEAMVSSASPPATCPGGGSHLLLPSPAYALHKDVAGSDEQQHWRRCFRCHGLSYWDGSRPPGWCPMGGRHEQQSADYAVPVSWSADLSFLAHESGHAFGLDHSFSTSRVGEFYDDNRPGAYGDPMDIMGGPATFAAPLYTPGATGLAAPTLIKFGWLTPPHLAQFMAPTGGTYEVLAPLHGGEGTLRAMQVVVPDLGRIYTAELRSPVGWDAGLRTPRVAIHERPTLYGAGEPGWRWCTNCQGMIWAGQMWCPAGGLHEVFESWDYALPIDAGPDAGESGWAWCKRCCGLYFAGGGSGACPAGGAHDGSDSGNYSLSLSGSGEPNWQRCTKCLGLARTGIGVVGDCPVGGIHDPEAGSNYVVDGAGGGRQNKWRRCQKCQGLFYAGLGACAGGDVHAVWQEGLDIPLSGKFALTAALPAAPGQSSWRRCSKCLGLAYDDGSGAPGWCPAGDQHDFGSSPNYTMPRDAETERGQRQWWMCTQCTALTFVDPAVGPSLCSNPASSAVHTLYQLEWVVPYAPPGVFGIVGFQACTTCGCLIASTAPGTALCANGAAHSTGGSTGYAVRTNPGPLVREMSFWRVCGQCGVLFKLASPDGSKERPCPNGGNHVPRGEYFVTYITSAPFWRWCNRCASMAYWDGFNPPGPCPAPEGGNHDHTGSGAYIPPSFWLDATRVVADNLTAGGSWTDDTGRVMFQATSVDDHEATVYVNAS